MTAATFGKKYELMLIFHPTLTEKEVQKELDTIKALIEKHGELFHEQIWGKRDLYYKLKGQEKGIYAVLDVNAKAAMNFLNRELKLMPHVLRYLLLELPGNYEIKPHVVIEEEKKPRRGEREVKERRLPVAPVRKTRIADSTWAATAPATEAVAPAEVAAPEEEGKLKPKKDKKGNFDEKIDEIIENLDKL